jgi:hypothetical protein
MARDHRIIHAAGLYRESIASVGSASPAANRSLWRNTASHRSRLALNLRTASQNCGTHMGSEASIREPRTTNGNNMAYKALGFRWPDRSAHIANAAIPITTPCRNTEAITQRFGLLSFRMVMVLAFIRRTPAISGSRPWANHTAGFYRESAALRGSTLPAMSSASVASCIFTTSASPKPPNQQNAQIIAV